jgi:uncharacterized membrane protein (DUF2068 family)
MARCTRCDAWVVVVAPPSEGEAEATTLPPLRELPVPQRGSPLRDTLVLRLIAIDRGVHAVVFGALAAGLLYLDLHLGALRTETRHLLNAISSTLSSTGQDPSRDFVIRSLTRVLHLSPNTIAVLAGTAIAYCVVESVEAVGLWRERRWAEYLTAVATAGFLPFEIKAILESVTALRVITLVINVAILAWLLWKKRLFGIRGGPRPHDADIDREALFGPPARADAGRHDEPAPVAGRAGD